MKAEVIKRVIESYGGKVEIQNEGKFSRAHILEQPKGLQTVHLKDRKFFDPIRIDVAYVTNEVTIGTTGSHYTFSQAVEYSRRLSLAIRIVRALLCEEYDSARDFATTFVEYIEKLEKMR